MERLLDTRAKQLCVMSDSVITDDYKNIELIEELGKGFSKAGFVSLPNFFTDSVLSLLKEEARKLYCYKVRKNFIMPGYETPRKMSVIGGKSILENSFIFPALYLDKEVKKILSQIANDFIFNINHEEELMVINCLDTKDSTHGWHLDDPQYALVIVLESPPICHGGYLEIIADWHHHCQKNGLDPIKDTCSAVKLAKVLNKVEKVCIEAGGCYLLNASACLHRVAPIIGELSRVAVNFAFHHSRSFEYGVTANLLYKSNIGEELA